MLKIRDDSCLFFEFVVKSGVKTTQVFTKPAPDRYVVYVAFQPAKTPGVRSVSLVSLHFASKYCWAS